MIEVEFDNGFVLNCDLILSHGEKMLGLKNFSSLAQDSGLWFTYDVADYYMFWNKGVEFPIDILFLDDMEINTIVSLEADSNKIVMPVRKSDFIIEINKGVAKEAGLRVGSKIVKIKNK
tara:strand:- start:117 stop:473 length:357 start_codon:yes stop_codon:yes gene_type:complete